MTETQSPPARHGSPTAAPEGPRRPGAHTPLLTALARNAGAPPFLGARLRDGDRVRLGLSQEAFDRLRLCLIPRTARAQSELELHFNLPPNTLFPRRPR